MKILYIFFACLVFVSGCAPTQETHTISYWDLPTTHTMPSNEQERISECGRIRDQMERVRTEAIMAPRLFSEPIVVIAAQENARREYAALQNRAAAVNCRAAFSSTGNSSHSFDSCFSNCKKYTSRTNEACFDSCKN